MFGSPMEDGRVVGSGSPPRENGKVDREIGLPPVPATVGSRYIGQCSKALIREIIEKSSLDGFYGRCTALSCITTRERYDERERKREKERDGKKEKNYCFLNSRLSTILRISVMSELFSSCWN